MSRSFDILTLIILCTVLVGCIFMPADPTFWLASATPFYTLIRVSLIFLIVTFLLFDVPSNSIFSLALGFFAFSITVWALLTTYNESTQLLDGLTISAAGIVLGVDSLIPDYSGQANDNWEVLLSPLKLFYLLLKRRAVYYAVVVFMVLDIFSQAHILEHPYIKAVY